MQPIASRATMLKNRLQTITNLMASMELLHQLRESKGVSMDPNVWFDDASIIQQACNEDVIGQDTRDALLRLNKAYQRAKHRNDFSAEDDETKKKALNRFVPDASGFATSTPFLAERACVIYRESQRSLLRDLGDLAAETIEADDDDEQ